jgi:transcriptional regulator with PAS, ATPase and Fis domain
MAHLPEELTARASTHRVDTSARSAHDLLDQQVILNALERNGFNRLAAARELKIHKTTLFRKMKKLGLLLPDRDGRNRKVD